MIRPIAANTRTLAQVLRAFNRRTFNTPTESYVGARTPDVYELIADQAHDLDEEQCILYDERIRAVMDDTDSISGPIDAPSQLVDESAKYTRSFNWIASVCLNWI